MHTFPPAWHRQAKCYGCDDPTVWDSSGSPQNTPEKIMRSVLACEGCPVASECAAAALVDRSLGVVVAGVPLPTWPWWTPSYRPDVRRTLRRIADGQAIHTAVAREMCTSPTMRRTADWLLARLTQLYETGAIQLGGTPTDSRGAYV